MTQISEKEEVVFKGMDGKATVEAKSDVGAERTCIDYLTAAKVSAGPVVKSVKVRSSSGTERRPVVKVWVELKDFEEVVPVSLSDREGMSTDAILGKDVLQAFEISVDNA